MRHRLEVFVRSQGITDELVAAAQTGDVSALRDIYDELAAAVCGYLRVKGVADPEGVTSDVFLAVFPRLADLTGGAAGLRKLVFSIAHARMVDEHRARARRPELVDYDAVADVRTTESAEDTAHVALGTSRVVEVLALLPEDQRTVLSLRVIADLSLEQVAVIMDRSVGAVKQLQRRALVSIREVLESGRVTL